VYWDGDGDGRAFCQRVNLLHIYDDIAVEPRLVSSLTGMEFHWNISLEFQPERRSRGLSLGV